MTQRGTLLATSAVMAAHVTFPSARTALLVIDPVNDFLSEGGAAWHLTKLTVEKHDVIGHLRAAIDAARMHGIPVLFGPMAYTEEDYAAGQLQRRSGINRFMFEKKMFLAGSWGADFHPDLRPRHDEIVLLPHKGIDVFETDLPAHLERLGTTHLVIAGMTASLCCESTGRRAMERGFDVTFLSDAIGADNPLSYEAAVHLDYPMIANAVMTVAEFIGAIGEAREDGIRRGDLVRGSDHLVIGKVVDVVQATDTTDGHLRVRWGRVFRRTLYVPLDAVVRRSGHAVFINIPRLVVRTMPWRKPPRAAKRDELYGAPAAEVTRLYRTVSPSGAR